MNYTIRILEVMAVLIAIAFTTYPTVIAAEPMPEPTTCEVINVRHLLAAGEYLHTKRVYYGLKTGAWYKDDFRALNDQRTIEMVLVAKDRLVDFYEASDAIDDQERSTRTYGKYVVTEYYASPAHIAAHARVVSTLGADYTGAINVLEAEMERQRGIDNAFRTMRAQNGCPIWNPPQVSYVY